MRTLCQLKIKCINTHGTQRLTSGKYFVVWGSIPLLRTPSMTSPIPHFTNVTGIVCLQNATLSPEYGSANPSLFTSQTVKDEEYTLCLFKYLCAFFKEMVGFFFLNEIGLYSWKKNLLWMQSFLSENKLNNRACPIYISKISLSLSQPLEYSVSVLASSSAIILSAPQTIGATAWCVLYFGCYDGHTASLPGLMGLNN